MYINITFNTFNNFVYLKRNFHLLELRINFLTCFKHQINITIVSLFYGNFFRYESVFCVHGVFKCNKLAVYFKLTLDMISVVLYKYLNCTAEKTIGECHTASTDCNY